MGIKVALFLDNSDINAQRVAEVLIEQGLQMQVFDNYEKLAELAERGLQLRVDVAVVHLGLLVSGEKGIFMRDDVVNYMLPEETRRVFTGDHPVWEIKDEVITARGDHYMDINALWHQEGIKVLKYGRTRGKERNNRGESFTTEKGLSFGMESHLKIDENEQGDGDRDNQYWKK